MAGPNKRPGQAQTPAPLVAAAGTVPAQPVIPVIPVGAPSGTAQAPAVAAAPGATPTTATAPTTVAAVAAQTADEIALAKKRTELELQGFTPEVINKMLEKKPEAKLPNGKFTDAYNSIQEELKKSGSDAVNNGLALAAKIFYVLAKYYSVVGGFMPDAVANSLKEGSLKDEKLTAEQAQKLKEHADANNGPWTDADAVVAQDKYNGMTTPQASTRYVSSMLGLEELDDANLLAARLSHTTRNGSNYYEQYSQTDIASLTGMKTLPKGTVVFFKHGLTGDLMSGYATGEGHQIAFFNAKAGSVEKFDMKTGKCSFGTVAFQLGLFPKFVTDARFFEDNPGQVESNLAGPIEKTSAALKTTRDAYDSRKINVIKGSGNPKTSQDAINFIVSSGLLDKKLLPELKAANKEIEAMQESDKKTEFLEKFKAEVKGYKDYLEAESKAIQELIEKEKARITELEAPLKDLEAAELTEELEANQSMSLPDGGMSIAGPQMSFDPDQIKADVKEAEKVIAAYEKLDTYIKKTAGELENI